MNLELVSTVEDKRKAISSLEKEAHHIDDEFWPLIRDMNEQLTLYTTQCCQGHEDAPGEEPGSGFRRAYLSFRCPYDIGTLTENVLAPMLAKTGEEYLSVALECEGGRLRYILWLDNKEWERQAMRFMKLYKKLDDEEWAKLLERIKTMPYHATIDRCLEESDEP